MLVLPKGLGSQPGLGVVLQLQWKVVRQLQQKVVQQLQQKVVRQLVSARLRCLSEVAEQECLALAQVLLKLQLGWDWKEQQLVGLSAVPPLQK